MLGRLMDLLSGLLGQKAPEFMTAAGFSDSPHFMYSGNSFLKAVLGALLISWYKATKTTAPGFSSTGSASAVRALSCLFYSYSVSHV